MTTDNSHHNKVSKIATKKLSTAIDYLLYASKPKVIPRGFKGAGNKFNICFITLTLSSKQIHSDKEIIKSILQPLLNYLRKHYHTELYVWRAEKQKNGNIHFHLLIDKWINYQDLREHWNKYQQNLGYVTRYADYQREYHRRGFTLRKNLLKNWNADQQFNAFKRGNSENWNNPNSVDIHSTKRIKNLKKYLCKYLTKQPYEKIKEEQIERSSINDLLSIDSRLWACSELLSSCRGAKTDIDSDYLEELEKLKKDKKVKTVIGDYYTISYVDIRTLNYREFPHILTLFSDYIKEKFDSTQ